MESSLEQLDQTKCFDGYFRQYQTVSTHCGGLKIKFGLYLPKGYEEGSNFRVLYYLAGLTCTEQQFMIKATIGFKYASDHGFVLVFPDTSPRGAGVEGEKDFWDFGEAASFYIDSKTEKFKTHYNMESFITKELIPLVNANFKVDPEK